MSAGRKPSLPRHEIPGQLWRFGLSSAFSATVSLGLPLVLHEWLRLDPTLSVGISQTTVLLANFLMIRMFVFRSQSGARGDFLRYTGSAVAFRGLEFLTFLLLFRFAGLFYFTALVLTLAASTAIKFFWYRCLFGGRVSSAL
jgi:putative flippase GtrA